MATQDDTQSSLMSRLPFFGKPKAKDINSPKGVPHGEDEQNSNRPPKWSFGVLNDKNTIEVPGSVLLLADHRNEPLGLRNAPARTSHSSIPVSIRHSGYPTTPKAEKASNEKKKTPDGKIILDPQPEDVPNDPLNWPTWRRDAALLSIGIYCMVGGGQTSVLAAGFTNVAEDYGVPVSKVSLTTGLYMMGLGIGSVIASPTAILWGKRPVYLVSALCFIITSVWCALSPNYASLILARIFQGMSVSPVECLPSATVAEIFFLHERAFRLGIYTLLLLGGKNLVPLVAAVVVQNLSWRWVFWVVALVVAFCSVLLFLFVSESFWLRVPHARTKAPSRPGLFQRMSSRYLSRHELVQAPGSENALGSPKEEQKQQKPHKDVHFSTGSETETVESQDRVAGGEQHVMFAPAAETVNDHTLGTPESKLYQHKNEKLEVPRGESSSDEPIVPTPKGPLEGDPPSALMLPSPTAERPSRTSSLRSYLPWSPRDPEKREKEQADLNEYVEHWREREAKSFVQQLRPWHGRLNKDSWLKVMVRPFILFAYPAVLWSSAIYACSVGWLIVVSESIAVIYREKYYHFDALGVGLIYISPFVGGILGTAVAGKVSDIFVKAMAKRNGGLYEPEFRLIMALPIGISTVIGLMGFGWSAQEQNHWIVPTVFLGVISFGCCLGSTTSITFCVDSYRQYAGEALVTLNLSKNILHGLVFSLFVTEWLEEDGSKSVFIWLGVIQLIIAFTAAPLYVYGKRLRMWTLRANFMEKF